MHLRSPVVLGTVLLALAACTTTERLPPEDVLRNAARAGQELQSVRFEGKATLAAGERSAWQGRADVTLEGRLQDGGAQTEVGFTLHGESAAPQHQTVDGSLRIVVAGADAVYLNLVSLSLDPPHPLLSSPIVAALFDRWWVLKQKQMSPQPPVTPPPRLLTMQASVVEVVNDRGFASLRGRTAYRYDVALDEEKAIAFLRRTAEERGDVFDEASARTRLAEVDLYGSFWIDAESFVVHRLQWKAVPKDGDGFRGEILLDFTEHNAVAPITPPSDALPLSPEQFGQFLSGTPTTFPPDVLDSFLPKQE